MSGTPISTGTTNQSELVAGEGDIVPALGESSQTREKVTENVRPRRNIFAFRREISRSDAANSAAENSVQSLDSRLKSIRGYFGFPSRPDTAEECQEPASRRYLSNFRNVFKCFQRFHVPSQPAQEQSQKSQPLEGLPETTPAARSAASRLTELTNATTVLSSNDSNSNKAGGIPISSKISSEMRRSDSDGVIGIRITDCSDSADAQSFPKGPTSKEIRCNVLYWFMYGPPSTSLCSTEQRRLKVQLQPSTSVESSILDWTDSESELKKEISQCSDPENTTNVPKNQRERSTARVSSSFTSRQKLFKSSCEELHKLVSSFSCGDLGLVSPTSKGELQKSVSERSKNKLCEHESSHESGEA